MTPESSLRLVGWTILPVAFFAIFPIDNKNLAIANKPRDAATLFHIRK